MKRWVGVWTVILALVVSVGLWLLTRQNPAFPPYSPDMLAFSAAMTIIHLGAAILFSLGLKTFTPKLKAAYRIFCVGIVLFAVAELQLPIGTLLGFQTAVWFSASLILPVVVGVYLVYVGLRRLAILFNVKSVWLSHWFVIAFALSVSAASYFLPVGSFVRSEQEAHATVVLVTLTSTLFFAGAMLAYKTWMAATALYARALFWLFLAQVALTVGTFINVIAYVFLGPAHWFLLGAYTILIESFLSISLVKAAYDFSIINETTTSPASNNANIIDVVIAAAAKASNITVIDPMLDPVRVITAKLQPGQTPAGTDQTALVNTYKNIERYLIETEPVRRYSRDELRTILTRDLHLPSPGFFDAIDKA